MQSANKGANGHNQQLPPPPPGEETRHLRLYLVRTLLHAQLSDYLAEANPFSIDADELLDIFHVPTDPDEAEYFLSPEECQEIISIVNTYWLSNRPSEQWAKDILWWPTLVK